MKQSLQDVKILLLDIEGTVCPISFVKDTLFPYALNALPQVLEKKWTSTDFQPYKSAFPESAQKTPAAFLNHVQDLTQRDVKIAYLKNLQGYLWEEGYKSSAYSTPLFNDIQHIFHHPSEHEHEHEHEHEQGQKAEQKIAIYSSGSIFAQKLLFAHSQWPATTSTTTTTSSSNEPPATTNSGPVLDNVVGLTPQITAYFDTTTAGPKTESASYSSIARMLEVASASDILFLSDNVLEVGAALAAGLRAIVVDRPGNAPLSEEDRQQFDIVTSFNQLNL